MVLKRFNNNYRVQPRCATRHATSPNRCFSSSHAGCRIIPRAYYNLRSIEITAHLVTSLRIVPLFTQFMALLRHVFKLMHDRYGVRLLYYFWLLNFNCHLKSANVLKYFLRRSICPKFDSIPSIVSCLLYVSLEKNYS